MWWIAHQSNTGTAMRKPTPYTTIWWFQTETDAHFFETKKEAVDAHSAASDAISSPGRKQFWDKRDLVAWLNKHLII